MSQKSISLPDLIATEKFAQVLALHMKQGDIVGLEGPLGAGKTTFARALLQALDVEGDIPSPTFTLLQTYETLHFPIHHFDLYRLKSEDELDELGWDDLCVDGCVLVEWPERGESRMPADRLVLKFTISEKNERRCLLEPHGIWVERLNNILVP